jgi:putative methyltransferase
VSEPVLRNINRQNFTVETFSEIVKRYNEHTIPTYTELILGLPGETLQSFKEGMCSLVEAGQHNAMTVYGCQVFRNAQMCQPAYRERFGIRSVKAPINFIHASLPDANDITEYTELVVATKDMPFDDMIDAILFCTCLQGFHHIGLLKYFALYVRNELGVHYLDFYDSLLRYIRQADGTFLQRLFARFRSRLSDLSLGEWTYYDPKFGKMGWYYEEGLFMEIASEFETFWDEIMPFLRTFPVPEDVFLQLTAYQKFVVRLVGQKHLCKTFDYDFYTYFENAINMRPTPLQKRKMTIGIDVREPVDSWETYALRVMLYAKKKGATLYTNDKEALSVSYEDESL